MKQSKQGSLLARFVGNTGWMMFRHIYSMLVSLVVGSLSARYLGPSNYGLINYATSIIAFFTTISKLGMDSIVVAEMSKNPSRENVYLGSALVMRLIASILSFFAICGIVCVLESGNSLLQIVTCLQAVAIIFQSVEVFYFYFQVHLEMKYVTIASILALTVTAVWRIMLLINEAGVQWFAMSASVSALVSGICIVIFYVRRAGWNIEVSFAEGRGILRNSYHFIINGLAVTLYTQLDRIMLGKMVSTEAVGFYAAASTIAVMWEFVPNALVNSATPILIKARESDEEAFEHKYRLLLLAVVLMGICVGIGFTVAGRLIVHILYGTAYEASVSALRILIWSTSFALIGTTRSIWIVSERKFKYSKYFTMMGACVNVLLNAILIPKLGIDGAAIATLISQITVNLFAPLCFKATRPFAGILAGMWREIPACADIIRTFIKR